MTIEELRKGPHLSASSICDYIDCGLLYKFGRIDKLPMELKSAALEFGTVIHLVLAEFQREKMLGNRLYIKEMQESFEIHWHENAYGIENIQYPEGKDFETLLLEGKELLSAYYNKLPDDAFKVVAIEEPFSFMIEECPVPIIGAVDLVEEDEGTIIITDFKTSGKAYSLDEVDRNFQLTLYQIAARKSGYRDRDILLRFDCLIKTKTPKFEQYYTTRTEIDEKRAIKKIQEVWKGIQSGVFIPNDSPSNWKCKGCPFKKACNDWFER
jgi:putative RecB family exonuclease